VRVRIVEDWLDDMIEITDHDDLDPLDKQVRIEARRWIMSKVAPQRYGDKVIVGGGAVSLSDLSDEQLEALEALAALRLPDDEVERSEVQALPRASPARSATGPWHSPGPHPGNRRPRHAFRASEVCRKLL
jgi:hypothetical protein